MARTGGFLAFLVFALGFYFLLLGRIGVELMTAGGLTSIGLGVGVFILPLIGVWVVVATFRATMAQQRLARLIHDEGLELDVTDLPRRASGRIERDAADALFERVKAECESDPDNWRGHYRVARAYDYAGDRTRARETMRTAVELERRESRP